MPVTITYDTIGHHERWTTTHYATAHYAGQWAIYTLDEQRIITLRDTCTDALRTMIEWETTKPADPFPNLTHATQHHTTHHPTPA